MGCFVGVTSEGNNKVVRILAELFHPLELSVSQNILVPVIVPLKTGPRPRRSASDDDSARHVENVKKGIRFEDTTHVYPPL